MITIQVKNVDGQSVIPAPGSKVAAGYDLVATGDPIIVGKEKSEGLYSSVDYLEYHTTLYISPQTNPTYHTLIYSRSSVRNYNLMLANSVAVIDNDYRGEIILCFKYIWQPEDFEVYSKSTSNNSHWVILGKINKEKIYKKGDKIAQLVASETKPVQFRLVSELDATERGDGGFGSTDHRLKITEYPDNVSSMIAERYKQAGGIPIKKKYSDEVKEREQQ